MHLLPCATFYNGLAFLCGCTQRYCVRGVLLIARCALLLLRVSHAPAPLDSRGPSCSHAVSRPRGVCPRLLPRACVVFRDGEQFLPACASAAGSFGLAPCSCGVLLCVCVPLRLALCSCSHPYMSRVAAVLCALLCSCCFPCGVRWLVP